MESELVKEFEKEKRKESTRQTRGRKMKMCHDLKKWMEKNSVYLPGENIIDFYKIIRVL